MTPRPLAELPQDVVDQVVRLHVDTLDGLLTRLGAWFVRRYYRHAVQDPGRLGFFVEREGSVGGLVVGSARPDDDFGGLVRPPVSFVGALLRALVARPGLLWQLASSWWGVTGASALADGEIELTYLAVDPSWQGEGVGRALIEAFCEAAAERGHTAVVLSVEEENPAVRFYERLSFEVRSRVVEGRFARLRMVRLL